MGLSKSRYGEIKTIRAFFDVVQYAKAIGYVKNIFNNNSSPQTDEDANPYDANPAKVDNYLADNEDLSWSGSENHLGFNVEFKSMVTRDRNFAKILRSINYYGFFGHNLATASDRFTGTKINTYGATVGELGQENFIYSEPNTYSSIVGDRNDTGNGYTIIGVDNWNQTNDKYFQAIKVYLNSENGFVHNEDSFNIGWIGVGQYMDFPQNANLSMNIKYNYDGIRSKNSISGRTITNISYCKPPNWGNYPRWTHISSGTLNAGGTIDDNWVNRYDMRSVSATGRRQWDLTWSFLDKTDTFPKTNEGNMFASNMETQRQFDVNSDLAIHGITAKPSIIGTMMTLTLGGQIPFLLQMDNTQQDFALVKIDQKGISIQQAAPQLYTIKLKLTEVW